MRMPLTSASNHNGRIREEVRIVYVSKLSAEPPVFLRLACGLMSDVSTLSRTSAELSEAGLDASYTALDAGYRSGGNAQATHACGVSFLTHLKPGRRLYELLIAEVLPRGPRVGPTCAWTWPRARRRNAGYSRGSSARGRRPPRRSPRWRRRSLHAGLHRRRPTGLLPVPAHQAGLRPVQELSGVLPLRAHPLPTFTAAAPLYRAQSLLAATPQSPFSVLTRPHDQKCRVYGIRAITTEPTGRMNGRELQVTEGKTYALYKSYGNALRSFSRKLSNDGRGIGPCRKASSMDEAV